MQNKLPSQKYLDSFMAGAQVVGDQDVEAKITALVDSIFWRKFQQDSPTTAAKLYEIMSEYAEGLIGNGRTLTEKLYYDFEAEKKKMVSDRYGPSTISALWDVLVSFSVQAVHDPITSKPTAN